MTFNQNEKTIKIDLLNLDPSGLAYLWEDTPTVTNFGLPIYAADEYHLPGAPWKVYVNGSQTVKVQLQHSPNHNQNVFILWSLLLLLLFSLWFSKRSKHVVCKIFMLK